VADLIDELTCSPPPPSFLSHQPSLAAHLLTLTLASLAGTYNAARTSPSAQSSSAPPCEGIFDHLLNLIPVLHKLFARYDDVDEATYTQFKAGLPLAPPILPLETQLIDKSIGFDDQEQQHEREAELRKRNLPVSQKGWQRISHTVRESVACYKKVENSSSAWGKAVGTIDVAAPRVFADCWLLDSYANRRAYLASEGQSNALRRVSRAIMNTPSRP